jgi:hypothetical protein
MLIYLDESYDNEHRFLLLGALFNPHPRYLNRRVAEIKRQHGFLRDDGRLREMKYRDCLHQTEHDVAREMIDAFFDSTSWFRCIAVEQAKVDPSRFGKPDETDNIKRARAYKKFAELLVAHNTEDLQGGVLLADGMTRCRGDEFRERMKDIFSTPNCGYSIGKVAPTLRHVAEIDSAAEHYQVLQVCDLLLGCILNNLFPTSNAWKNRLREYLVQRLGVASLLPQDWARYSKRYAETYHPKFNVWYWTPRAQGDPKKRLG